MARVVITAVVLEGRSKSAVARDYGVSRRWVQTLAARYLAEGESAFEPRSRRPHSSSRQTGQAVEGAIVALRKSLTEAGHDAGAETIASHLRRQSGSAPSPATIWRILSRRGFVTPQPHKRPRSSWRRFEADLPNEVWQAGITHWPLAGGPGAEILNIFDDHSQARRIDPTLAARYHRLMVTCGKHHNSALCHISTALLTRIIACWRAGTPYQIRDTDGSPPDHRPGPRHRRPALPGLRRATRPAQNQPHQDGDEPATPSCADPMCSISRDPRREENTICTPDAVFTVRTYGTRPLYDSGLVRPRVCQLNGVT